MQDIERMDSNKFCFALSSSTVTFAVESVYGQPQDRYMSIRVMNPALAEEEY